MPKSPFQRQTRQRQVIVDELRRLDTHPTASELCDLVRQRLPRISLATVYRNLERLAACGMILKLDMGAGQARFDGDTSMHHHIRCTTCGRVADATEVDADFGLPAIDRIDGYEVDGFRLEFLGRCPACQRQTEAAVAD